MKRPCAYLPLYGHDFFQAIAGYSDAVGMAYLRALWHSWNHGTCQGLPDVDGYLSRVCGCEGAEWVRTKGIIFDNRYFFRLEDGLWQPVLCRHEWYEKRWKGIVWPTG